MLAALLAHFLRSSGLGDNLVRRAIRHRNTVVPPEELWSVIYVIPFGYQEGEASASKGRKQLPLRRPAVALPLNLPCGSGCSELLLLLCLSLHCEQRGPGYQGFQ